MKFRWPNFQIGCVLTLLLMTVIHPHVAGADGATKQQDGQACEILSPVEGANVDRVEQIRARLAAKGWPLVLVQPVVEGEPWYAAHPVLEIGDDGQFVARAHFGGPRTPAGTKFHVIVVVLSDKRQAEGFPPGKRLREIPAAWPRSAPATVVRRAPAAKAPIAKEPTRIVDWGGYRWSCKQASSFGPGPNAWSADERDLFTDKTGALHLTISERNGVWLCTEVKSLESLGWGDYEWRVDLPQEAPAEVVFALFVYHDDTAEIEALEWSKWSDPDNANNCQYCLQPATNESMHRFNVPPGPVTVRFSWRRDHAAFSCWRAGEELTAEPIASWRYSGPKLFWPSGRERVHMNYWLVAGKPPSAKPPEVVIRSFSFKPAVAAGVGASAPGRPQRYP